MTEDRIQTTEAIDILDVASRRYHAAADWFTATQAMQNSPQAIICMNEAMIALSLAGKDQETVRRIALELAEDENGI